MGYTVKLYDNNPMYGSYQTIDEAFEGVVDHLNLWLDFEQDVDTSNFEKAETTQQKVISDFEEFISKKGLTPEDKQELLDIIKRGKWN
jgi:hypothetical protein